jgi:hypothetical protein
MKGKIFPIMMAFASSNQTILSPKCRHDWVKVFNYDKEYFLVKTREQKKKYRKHVAYQCSKCNEIEQVNFKKGK